MEDLFGNRVAAVVGSGPGVRVEGTVVGSERDGAGRFVWTVREGAWPGSPCGDEVQVLPDEIIEIDGTPCGPRGLGVG